MVKITLILALFLNSFLFANVYEKNCVTCHNKLPVSIDKYFYRYLLKYSSKRAVNAAMLKYLKNPSKDTTIMPDAFISRFGIKNKSTLSDEELKKALDEYWDIYKVFGKLK
ncbi:conserved hypothetical protein [Arcobacter nitrofigilis DSM 7299]|uniref:Cytochrome c domain-containing protein n=1 Tax=Arcobacter nitrofigilis (strain ATCC 33309 / DSM 7299 / CCUG 15893 / LMG 7604 / NCTC 12251 / CI) TaxID=572480 RepID=D5V1Y0_ARCNC|nr:hypothetical protein [Arcobacter nitrofigilis]ADG93564.1 conserved hypothetical protein [Arcobacter nitrofigilis DSM 7299]